MARQGSAELDKNDPEYLMLPGEIGDIFRVDSKTVTRWAKAGRFLDSEVVRTGGGHVRIKRKAVNRLMGIEADLAA